MPTCINCGTAAAFHELTNYDAPAPRDGTPDATERLCRKCEVGALKAEIECVRAKCAVKDEALIQLRDYWLDCGCTDGSFIYACGKCKAKREVIEPALSTDAGSGYVPKSELDAAQENVNRLATEVEWLKNEREGMLTKEQVKPVYDAARVLAERAPSEDYPYPKEWDNDPCFVKRVPYCELIFLRKALAHAKTLGIDV